MPLVNHNQLFASCSTVFPSFFPFIPSLSFPCTSLFSPPYYTDYTAGFRDSDGHISTFPRVFAFISVDTALNGLQ